MTFDEYQKYSRNMRERAERLKNLILADARKTCAAAGLDPGLLGIHPHNAMCGLRSGHPWPEVNYSLCRKTLFLCERSYEPHRLVGKILGRAWDQVSREVYGYKG